MLREMLNIATDITTQSSIPRLKVHRQQFNLGLGSSVQICLAMTALPMYVFITSTRLVVSGRVYPPPHMSMIPFNLSFQIAMMWMMRLLWSKHLTVCPIISIAMYIRAYVCMYIRAYVCMYIHTYVCAFGLLKNIR